jgi:hypothetical protein
MKQASVREPGSGFRRGRTVSLAQALSPIPSHEFTNRTTEQFGSPLKSLELKSAETFFWPSEKWGRDALLMTIHSSPWGHADMVRFFLRNREQCVAMEEIQIGGESLDAPQYFEEGTGTGGFIMLTGHDGGASSDYPEYHLVWVGGMKASVAKEVPIEDPVMRLQDLMRPGQHSDRFWIQRVNGQLTFSFAIWNEKDPNNFPTGGGITGTMKILVDGQGDPTKLVVDEWHQDAYQP